MCQADHGPGSICPSPNHKDFLLTKTSSSIVSLFLLTRLTPTQAVTLLKAAMPRADHCALTCLSSPFLQRTRTTGAPGKKVMTDRHSSSWRICWVYVKAQIWRRRGKKGHVRILRSRHWWDTIVPTCDNITWFGKKHWET